jgi:hypothetical protein
LCGIANTNTPLNPEPLVLNLLQSGLRLKQVEVVRIKLCQCLVLLDGSCNTFVDNNCVVTQTTKPESTLAKKHNIIIYHKVWESVAMGVQRIFFEKGCDNQADCLIKSSLTDAFTSD